jgi:hypothetical protein
VVVRAAPRGDPRRGREAGSTETALSRGQFSGGQVASTTRGGTNFVQGSFNYSLRDPALEVTNPDESGFSGGYLQNQLSGGLGGPIVHNKLFVFGSTQLRRRVDRLRSLTAAGGAPRAS